MAARGSARLARAARRRAARFAHEVDRPRAPSGPDRGVRLDGAAGRVAPRVGRRVPHLRGGRSVARGRGAPPAWTLRPEALPARAALGTPVLRGLACLGEPARILSA